MPCMGFEAVTVVVGCIVEEAGMDVVVVMLVEVLALVDVVA